MESVFPRPVPTHRADRSYRARDGTAGSICVTTSGNGCSAPRVARTPLRSGSPELAVHPVGERVGRDTASHPLLLKRRGHSGRMRVGVVRAAETHPRRIDDLILPARRRCPITCPVVPAGLWPPRTPRQRVASIVPPFAASSDLVDPSDARPGVAEPVRLVNLTTLRAVGLRKRIAGTRRGRKRNARHKGERE